MNNINNVLINHIISGGGPAITELRNSILKYSLINNKKNLYDKFLLFLNSFFEARTDIRRIIYAQKVAEILLETRDMKELTQVRKIVADLEMSHIIEYKSHRDHTAHTLYLFLLGVWLYDTIPLIRESYTSKLETQFKTEYSEWYVAHIFLLQWYYASLLHDIGYIFSELNSNTIEYRRKIDNLFDFKWLESEVLSEFEDKEKKWMRDILFKAYQKFKKQYWNKIPYKTYQSNNPIEIIERIGYMPWIYEISLHKGYKNDIYVLFNSNNREANELKSFAYKVAKSGYDKKGKGIVDHAIASGLLLLQYSTYWFWIIHAIKHMEFKAFKMLTRSFSTSNIDIIIDACRDTAYHNIQLKNTDKKFNLEEDPLLFLEILCDELSIWERFSASKKNLLDSWQENTFLESTDIIVHLKPNIIGTCAQF